MNDWLADALTDWFAEHGRPLPWREPDTTAWGVLVSEVMAQQTRVDRVAPIWREWMRRWPKPSDLAAAPRPDVLRAWGRLGYPRRALRLHDCAAVIAERHGGVVPDDLDDLLALPGIGTYTARAVAVFAYRQRHPVVDTNVRRVVARFSQGRPDAGMATTNADLAACEDLLPVDTAAAVSTSVALMELGALVCTARAPACGTCPLSARCAFRASGAALPDGPSRKTQRYHGTNRFVRGKIMALLRESADPVPRHRIDMVWPEAAKREQALAELVADGLVEALPDERFSLPA